LAGCGRTDVYDAILRPSRLGRPKSRADVYVGAQRPTVAFEELGLVQAVGGGNRANLEDVVHALAERAGAIGCDAVVRVVIDDGAALTYGFGTCVRYLSTPASAPAPAPGAPPPTDSAPAETR
jgi:hypothetical protein